MNNENTSDNSQAKALNKTDVISRFINYLLNKIVDFYIKHNLFSNVNKFKKGDYVVYNWKAKIVISTVIEPGIKRIISVENFKDGTASCDYENILNYENSSCDVFWIRKASKRELRKNGL